MTYLRRPLRPLSSTVGVAAAGYGCWGPNLVAGFAERTGVRVVPVEELAPEKLALVWRRVAEKPLTRAAERSRRSTEEVPYRNPMLATSGSPAGGPVRAAIKTRGY